MDGVTALGVNVARGLPAAVWVGKMRRTFGDGFRRIHGPMGEFLAGFTVEGLEAMARENEEWPCDRAWRAEAVARELREELERRAHARAA